MWDCVGAPPPEVTMSAVVFDAFVAGYLLDRTANDDEALRRIGYRMATTDEQKIRLLLVEDFGAWAKQRRAVR